MQEAGFEMKLTNAVLATALLATAGWAQGPHTNLDESKVGAYVLPDVLKTESGQTVRSAAQWQKMRRPEILRAFMGNVYGRMPGTPAGMHFRTDRVDRDALNGTAVRSEISIVLGNDADSPIIHVLLTLPSHHRGAVPVFVGLNFLGNHSTSIDDSITIQPNWLVLHHGDASTTVRGIQADRWPVRELVKRGYGVATAWYGDLEPDTSEGWKTGIRTTLAKPLKIAPEEWGAIGAWAWGLSRIQDFLRTNPDVDRRRIIVIGHSRLGKASLWAGANDTRFAMVVSNDSGEGGAALSRRNFGETIDDLVRRFPWWFVPRYAAYRDHPDRLPVDGHMLLALVAPRPLYVASATEDLWSDPNGEFLSAQQAGAVYALFGLRGLPTGSQPPPETPVGDRIRYHLRTGKHDITLYDWERYADFADRTLR